MRIEAEIELIRRCGLALKDAAAHATTIDPATAAHAVSIALTASSVAPAALRVAQVWREELGAWCRDADAHGADLIAAAKRYRADDRAAAADIQRIATPRGS